MDRMDPALVSTILDHLPPDGPVLAAGPAARRLPLPTDRVAAGDLDDLDGDRYTAVLLLDGELSSAGVHSEGLVDALGAVLEPGGRLIATVPNRVFAEATHRSTHGRAFSAAEARALVHQRGFVIELLCAPGATARLRGQDGVDVEADRRPGLLDAGPDLLLIARAPRSADERGRQFLDSRPRKIAAAATLVRDPDGRLLVVYDRFKRTWTIPGGVVDPDEDPADAAQRESWEEAGVKIETGRLLGVFAQSWPDRLVFVFGARPVEVVEQPQPVHDHEIGAVAWLPVDEALQRVAPDVAFKLRACLDTPGYTWHQ
jgi:8-oxo-dGTP pyrophosphatase MutT (NUDIX family)